MEPFCAGAEAAYTASRLFSAASSTASTTAMPPALERVQRRHGRRRCPADRLELGAAHKRFSQGKLSYNTGRVADAGWKPSSQPGDRFSGEKQRGRPVPGD